MFPAQRSRISPTVTTSSRPADLTAAVAEAVDRLLSPSVSDIAPRPTRPNRRRRPTRDAPELLLLDGN